MSQNIPRIPKRYQLLHKALLMVCWILSRDGTFGSRQLAEAMGMPGRTSRKWVNAAMDIKLIRRVDEGKRGTAAVYKRISHIKLVENK